MIGPPGDLKSETISTHMDYSLANRNTMVLCVVRTMLDDDGPPDAR